jgi:hypothetical protein
MATVESATTGGRGDVSRALGRDGGEAHEGARRRERRECPAGGGASAVGELYDRAVLDAE